MKSPSALLALAFALFSPSLGAQVPGQPSYPVAPQPLPAADHRPAKAVADYRIGPDDQLEVSVLQAPELETSARVSKQGAISLPLLGAVRAGGLTAGELESEIEDLLRRKYIKNPDVTVAVTEVRSRSVSVVGAVNRPGVVQLPGSATLLEVLSLAGGLREEAGDVAVVIRDGAGEGAAPLEVKLKPLLESRDPSLNVSIHPGDVVNVRTAEIVYVVGAVKKPGAFAMRGNERLTVLRALALGEGLLNTAAQKDALVVRTGQDGQRVELPVDLSALLKGKTPDVPLAAHDVLFVPTSGGKVVARTALDAFIRMLSWRPF